MVREAGLFPYRAMLEEYMKKRRPSLINFRLFVRISCSEACIYASAIRHASQMCRLPHDITDDGVWTVSWKQKRWSLSSSGYRAHHVGFPNIFSTFESFEFSSVFQFISDELSVREAADIFGSSFTLFPFCITWTLNFNQVMLLTRCNLIKSKMLRGFLWKYKNAFFVLLSIISWVSVLCKSSQSVTMYIVGDAF